MESNELALFKRLLKAAKAGECPAPDCKICQEKQEAIKDAEEYLKTVERG